MNVTKQDLRYAIHRSTMEHGRARTAWEGANLAAEAAWKLVQPVLIEMHRKIGDLEARNQRLHDEMGELDRENSDLGWQLHPEEHG